MRIGLILLFLILQTNIKCQIYIQVIDYHTKESIPFSIIQCDDYYSEADLNGRVLIPDIGKCDTLIFTCLGYKILRIAYKDIFKTKRIFLQPLSFEIDELTIRNRRINLIKELTEIVRKNQQENKKPILLQTKMLFQTRIDSKIVENCDIISTDYYHGRNNLQQMHRDRVKYSFAPIQPFFSVDLDILVKMWCNNIPNKNPNHLLQSKKVNDKILQVHLMDSEFSKDTSSEIRTVQYTFKNGNNGIIKYSWPNATMLEYSYEILGKNLDDLRNINPNNEAVIQNIKIKQEYASGSMEKLTFISKGVMRRTGEEVSSVLKLMFLPPAFETVCFPMKLDNNIQEDASLLASLALETEPISTVLFEESDLDSTLVTNNNIKALAILNSFNFHNNQIKLWDKSLNIDSTDYLFIPKKYDGLDKEISIATPDIKTDIRWLYQKKNGDAQWKSIPSIWVNKEAYFIKDHPTTALFFAKVIFDIFEAERMETLTLLNNNLHHNAEKANGIIANRYLFAERLSRNFAKSFSKSNRDDVISILHKLQEKLNTKYLLPDPKLLYKFDQQSSEYSMADIHYIIGNKEKAISEYHNMLQNKDIKTPQKATIFFNLSLLYCELGELEKSEMFFKNYIKLEHEIGKEIDMIWTCDRTLK